MDDIHSLGDELFIVNKPDRYPRKIKDLADLSILHEAPHPCGICGDRFWGGRDKEGVEDFDEVKQRVNI